MQYINIKEDIVDSEKVYLVNAISLNNKSNNNVQKIPHPLGTDVLVYKTLDEAMSAVTLAGFSYILPNGVKKTVKFPEKTNDSYYKDLVYKTIKHKFTSSNSNVVSASILALSEFPCEETFDLIFSKFGEENEQIRKNAISSIAKYSNKLKEEIIERLKAVDWVTRNSAISCISFILDNGEENVEDYIAPLVKACDDNNVIIQANAITVLSKVYSVYVKSNLK